MSKPFSCPGDVDEHGIVHLDMPSAQHRAVTKARFATKRVDVTISERKSKRSQQANAALHAGLHEWATALELTGTAKVEWVEDMKDDLLGLCFGYTVRQNQLTGEITKRLVEPHTSALTVGQFSELFDVAIVEAANRGHAWTAPDEWRERKAKSAKPAKEMVPK